jgi:hypothetical protein
MLERRYPAAEKLLDVEVKRNEQAEAVGLGIVETGGTLSLGRACSWRLYLLRTNCTDPISGQPGALFCHVATRTESFVQHRQYSSTSATCRLFLDDKRQKNRVEYLGYDSSWNSFMRHESFMTHQVNW